MNELRNINKKQKNVNLRFYVIILKNQKKLK